MAKVKVNVGDVFRWAGPDAAWGNVKEGDLFRCIQIDSFGCLGQHVISGYTLRCAFTTQPLWRLEPLQAKVCQPATWEAHVRHEQDIASLMTRDDVAFADIRALGRAKARAVFLGDGYEPSISGRGGMSCRLVGTAGKLVR